MTEHPIIRSTDVHPGTGLRWYVLCEECNTSSHLCHSCGEYLTHSRHDSAGNFHDTAFCRPDLVEHEPGPDCTWPDDPELNRFRTPGCYWDHERNQLGEPYTINAFGKVQSDDRE